MDKSLLGPKAGTGLVSVAFVIQVLSLVSPYWRSNDISYNGLWMKCFRNGDTRCDFYFDSFNALPAWFCVVQAFSFLSVIVGFLSFGCMISYLVRGMPDWRVNNVSFVGKFSAFGAGILNAITSVLYGVELHVAGFGRELSWAFGLECVSGGLFLAAAMVLSYKISTRTRDQTPDIL